MSELHTMKCEACNAEAPRVTEDELSELLAAIPDWQVEIRDGVMMLERCYKFNIISIFDIGVAAERPYFTMELKPGKTLADAVEGTEPLPLNSLLSVFMKICDAVSYAHSQGVVHLDLKPENIQVGKFGEVIVSDWGLGKVLHNKEKGGELLANSDLLNHMTLSGDIKGTPGFMSPEQITRKVAPAAASDIYSLGCTYRVSRPGAFETHFP